MKIYTVHDVNPRGQPDLRRGTFRIFLSFKEALGYVKAYGYPARFIVELQIVRLKKIAVE